jgi:hypothetical protein
MSKTFTNKELFGKKALNEYGVLGMHWGKGKTSKQPYTVQDRHDRKLPKGVKDYSKEIMAKFAAKANAGPGKHSVKRFGGKAAAARKDIADMLHTYREHRKASTWPRNSSSVRLRNKQARLDISGLKHTYSKEGINWKRGK